MDGHRFVRPLAAGLAYFAVAFGTGFALALVRIPLLEPRLGTRWAELVELPVLLAVLVVAAHRLARRFGVPSDPAPRLLMGYFALALLLVAEFALVLPLRGLSFADYLAQRDPVSGTAYYLSLLAFALFPALKARSG